MKFNEVYWKATIMTETVSVHMRIAQMRLAKSLNNKCISDHIVLKHAVRLLDGYGQVIHECIT